MPKTIVMIPTFNESRNIGRLIESINNLGLSDLSILVVDDDSPDGTAEIVKKYSHSFLLIRKGQRGRGTAGLVGLKKALDMGADNIIEMDADFSHDPNLIPEMLEKIKEYDVVVGSRFVSGGEDRRGIIRRLMTKLANWYIHRALNLKIRDCTSGYRCFRRQVLEAINLDNTVSMGPSIVQELLYKAVLQGFRIKEVPLVFIDRIEGRSTFNRKIMIQSFLMVLILRFLFSSIRKAEIHDMESFASSETYKIKNSEFIDSKIKS